MRFAVFTRQNNGFEQTILRDEYAQTEMVILPDYGGVLHALIVETTNGPFNILDNYENLEVLQKDLRESFKSSKLSPFVCRIPAGKFTHNGQLFEFENKYGDGSSIHGLLYNKRFKIIDSFCDDTRATAHLKYSYNKEDSGYPFEYRCEIHYTLLANNIIQLDTSIFNLDDKEIPLADGWHPYFKLGDRVDEWQLRFNANEMLEFDENLFPTGRLVPSTIFTEEQYINDTILDNCFVLNNEEAYAACTLFNPANGLAVAFFPDRSYPYLQVYTPPHRKSIAIENLSGAPNCFNNKMGLVLLPPGQVKTFTIRYQISIE